MARPKNRPANQRSKSTPKRASNPSAPKRKELDALKEMDKRLAKKSKVRKKLDVDTTKKRKLKTKVKAKTKDKKLSKKNQEKLNQELERFADQMLDMGDYDSDSEDYKEHISKFEEDFQTLREMVSPENDLLRVDQSSALFYRASLAMVLDLLPLAEKNYRESRKESAAYALNALINQGRDLNNDVKMSEDTAGQVLVLQQLVQTNFTRLADLLLKERHAFAMKVESLLKSNSDKKEIKSNFDATIKTFVKGANSLQDLLNLQISGYLHGDPSYLNPMFNSDNNNLSKPKKRKRKGK